MLQLASNMDLLMYLMIVISMIVIYIIVWCVSLKQDIVHLQIELSATNEVLYNVTKEIETLRDSRVYTSIGGH